MNLRGAIYGITAAAIWGGMYVVSDAVLPIIPPFTLLTLRLIQGTLILAFLVRYANLALPSRVEMLRLLGVGFIGFGISIGAQFIGTDQSTAVNGSIITSASPAFILIFAALLLRERLTMQRIAAVTLATVGVVIIVVFQPTQDEAQTASFFGDIAFAVAAFTWGLYSVLVRGVSAKHNTLVVTLFAFIGGMLLTVPAAAFELPARPVGQITPLVVAGVLYLGVVSTAVAMWLWNRAFALVEASIASLFFFAQPLVGALLAAIFLAQGMTSSLWVGGLLIILGVLLALYPVDALLKRRAAQNLAKSTEGEG